MCNLGEPQNLPRQNVENGCVIDGCNINVEHEGVAALQVAGQREASVRDQLHVQYQAVLMVLRSVMHVANLRSSFLMCVNGPSLEDKGVNCVAD